MSMQDGSCISFFVPWRVQPKQADRQQIRTRKDGSRYIHHYQSPKVTQNARDISSFVGEFVPSRPLEGPLQVLYAVTYPWRKSEAKKNMAAPLPKDTKPDVDQLAKQLSDVLEHAGFFANDSQIAELHVSKCWGDNPGVQIEIQTI